MSGTTLPTSTSSTTTTATELPPQPLDAGPLRQSGGVLLVSCYELGHQPLSLAFPNAALRDAGFAPTVVDTSVDELRDDAIRTAQLVAIAVPMHTALRLGEQIATRVRAVNPDARICCYGLYAWLNSEHLLRTAADYVIGGETERALVDLADALDRGLSDEVAGVTGHGFSAPPALERIAFPVPVRDSLPDLEQYAHLLIGGVAVRAGYTEATRGCHHTCLHCPVVPLYRGRFFAVPRAVVLADIRQQVLAGAGHITFGDPDFLNGPTHALRICRALHEEFPHVTFDITTRIEHILQHRAIFPELRDLGCVFVLSAVEIVADHVLEALDKGHTRANVVTALSVLDAAGIAMRPSLLPFTPWTTLDDYRDLLQFVADYDLIEHVDPVHYSIRLLVPPGSALLDDPERAALLGTLDPAAFSHIWQHPDPRMDTLHRAVSQLVEHDVSCETPPHETFTRLRELAWEVDDSLPPATDPQRTTALGQPPRLSESWFC